MGEGFQTWYRNRAYWIMHILSVAQIPSKVRLNRWLTPTNRRGWGVKNLPLIKGGRSPFAHKSSPWKIKQNFALIPASGDFFDTMYIVYRSTYIRLWLRTCSHVWKKCNSTLHIQVQNIRSSEQFIIISIKLQKREISL